MGPHGIRVLPIIISRWFYAVIASAAKQSSNASAETLWIASAFAKASADKSLRSQ
jgi:hypothetical protein